MSGAVPWRVVARGLELRVRLTPKSAHDRVEGLEATADGLAVKARVRAVPEDGKANAALEAVVAEWLKVPRRSVEVTNGGKSRIKTLTISGGGATLARAIQVALAALPSKTLPGAR